MFNHIIFERMFTAAASAAVLSTACVMGAVAPAGATDLAPITVADWQKTVNTQIDRTLRMPAGVVTDAPAIATLSVRFDDHGGFNGASIAKTSGIAALDAEALRTARAIHYPALPAGLHGKPQTVAMQLLFAQPRDGNVAPAQVAAAQMEKAARAATLADTIETASR